MKLFVQHFFEDFLEENDFSYLDNISFKDLLHYTSYGFFIGALISLFQGDIGHVVVCLLIAIFLKL